MYAGDTPSAIEEEKSNFTRAYEWCLNNKIKLGLAVTVLAIGGWCLFAPVGTAAGVGFKIMTAGYKMAAATKTALHAAGSYATSAIEWVKSVDMSRFVDMASDGASRFSQSASSVMSYAGESASSVMISAGKSMSGLYQFASGLMASTTTAPADVHMLINATATNASLGNVVTETATGAGWDWASAGMTAVKSVAWKVTEGVGKASLVHGVLSGLQRVQNAVIGPTVRSPVVDGKSKRSKKRAAQKKKASITAVFADTFMDVLANQPSMILPFSSSVKRRKVTKTPPVVAPPTYIEPPKPDDSDGGLPKPDAANDGGLPKPDATTDGAAAAAFAAALVGGSKQSEKKRAKLRLKKAV